MSPCRITSRWARWLLLVALLPLGGCALLSKSEPMQVRYFAPELALSPTTSASAPEVALRLGRIEASAHLRERMAFRKGAHELGYHERLRWTERPDAYLRRALGWVLFEQGRFRHVVAGPVPTLDAELLAFEELRDRDSVLIAVHVLVHQGRRVLLERTLRVEHARGEARSPEAVTAALSQALGKCVSEIAALIEQHVNTRSDPQADRPDGV